MQPNLFTKNKQFVPRPSILLLLLNLDERTTIAATKTKKAQITPKLKLNPSPLLHIQIYCNDHIRQPKIIVDTQIQAT